MCQVDHLKVSRKANNIGTAAPALVENIDKGSISPSDEAARLEALNTFDVDHSYFIIDAAQSANGRRGKSSQMEVKQCWTFPTLK
jgi:hypothetical protein